MIKKINIIIIFDLFLHKKFGVSNFEEYKILIDTYKETLGIK